MANQVDRTEDGGVSRRDFLKKSATATAAASLGIGRVERFAFGGARATLRVGLVGCGGRGTGAAANCVQSADGIEIAVMGDLFEDRLDESRRQLSEQIGNALTATGNTSFTGFDAFQHVIESDVDVVILATPPAFRAEHLEAAVQAGKHVFMEKPVAVDPAGVRRVIAAGEQAAASGLSIVAGTQRRHDPRYIETMKRVRRGDIGEVVTAQVYWNQGGLWKYDRKPGQSDMEWMIRNWLYYTWLSGDHIVEQHIHNLDVANWALGGPPVRANGVGGRQVRVDPAYGHIFDHFCVEFEYANGARVLSMCRQQDGTARFVGERIVGTKGRTDGYSRIEGENAWEWVWPDEDNPVNPYVQEHADLIAAIRASEPINEARRVAESTLTAIMGREAAYTGQIVHFKELMDSNQALSPDRWAFSDVPTPPVPAPGVTRVSRPAFAHSFAEPIEAPAGG